MGFAMKISNYFSFNNKLQGALVCLLGLFFVGQSVVAMDLPTDSNIIFVYEQGTSNFVAVKKEVYMLSEYIKSVLFGAAEIGLEQEEKRIELDFSFADIKKSFDVLEMYSRYKRPKDEDGKGLAEKALEKIIRVYDFDSLIGIANCIDFLMCPPAIKNICLQQIKKMADDSGKNLFTDSYFGPLLQELSTPLQASLFVDSSVNNLKALILDNLSVERTISLDKVESIKSPFAKSEYFFERSVTTTAWSLDGTRVCASVPTIDSDEVRLWDMTDQNNIVCQTILSKKATSIAFSPDSKQIVIDNERDSTIDIFDIASNRFIKRFQNVPGTVSKTVFTHDSTKLISVSFLGTNRSSFTLIDIASKTSKTIPHNFDFLDLPVISHDGKYIAMAVCAQLNWHIAFFDIADLDDITFFQSVPSLPGPKAIAFSLNDKKIVCSFRGNGYPLMLLDIGNIKVNLLESPDSFGAGYFESVAFTPDGENIVAAGPSQTEKPILALWNISGDLDNYSSHVLGIGRAVAVAPNFAQGCRIAFFDQEARIKTLFTRQEIAVFNEISQCNVDQIRLIYALSLRAIKSLANEKLEECTNPLQKGLIACRNALFSSKKQIELDNTELSVFEQLPQNLRQMLEQILNIKKPAKSSFWW